MLLIPNPAEQFRVTSSRQDRPKVFEFEYVLFIASVRTHWPETYVPDYKIKAEITILPSRGRMSCTVNVSQANRACLSETNPRQLGRR